MSSFGFSLRLRIPQPHARTGALRCLLKFNPEVVLQHRLEFPQDLDPTIIHGLILVALNRNYSLAAYPSALSKCGLVDAGQPPTRPDQARRRPDRICYSLVNRIFIADILSSM